MYWFDWQQMSLWITAKIIVYLIAFQQFFEREKSSHKLLIKPNDVKTFQSHLISWHYCHLPLQAEIHWISIKYWIFTTHSSWYHWMILISSLIIASNESTNRIRYQFHFHLITVHTQSNANIVLSYPVGMMINGKKNMSSRMRASCNLLHLVDCLFLLCFLFSVSRSNIDRHIIPSESWLFIIW